MTIAVNPITELSSEENELLLSAISLSSQEKTVAAELKDIKVKVTELFAKRFDTTKTGTIAKLGKSSIQVKRKAGKVVLTDELEELTKDIVGSKAKLAVANASKLIDLASKISELQDQIAKLYTSEEIEFMVFDLKQKVAALPEPEDTYEVAIKV